MNDGPERPPRGLVAALILTATLNPLNSTMIAVALPAIASAFGVSGGSVTTWLVSSYLIVNIVAVSPAGSLADLLGRRRALALGQGGLAAGALLGGLSPALSGVVIGRVLMAVGGAIVVPTAMAVLRETFAPERRARVFASLGALMGLAAAVGPVLGGVLTARAGWHAIFLVNAPVLLVAWLFVRKVEMSSTRSTSHAPPSTFRSFDLAGAALLVVGLGTVAVGLRMAAWRWGLLSIGVLALLAFVRRERRAAYPLIDLQLFRERHFVAGGLVIALQNLSMYALMFQVPFLLEGPLGIDPERGGRVLMTMMVAMVVSAPIGGRVSEHIGIRRTVLVGLAAGACGLLFGLQAVAQRDLPPLLVCLGGMGLGLGLATGPVQAAALSAVSTSQSGVASGVLTTMRYVGGVAGISIISAWLNGGSESDVLAGHQRCLSVYLVAYVLGMFLATMLPSVPRGGRPLASAT